METKQNKTSATRRSNAAIAFARRTLSYVGNLQAVIFFSEELNHLLGNQLEDDASGKPAFECTRRIMSSSAGVTAQAAREQSSLEPRRRMQA